MAEMGHKRRISVLLSPAFMSEMAPIPTEFCAPQRKSLSAINRHNQQLFHHLVGTLLAGRGALAVSLPDILGFAVVKKARRTRGCERPAMHENIILHGVSVHALGDGFLSV